MKLSIPLGGSLQNPAPSPDGKSISLTLWHDAYNDGRADVYTFNLATKQTFKLPVNGEANVSQPGNCWNQRGIIFSTDHWGADCAAYWDGAALHRLFDQGRDQTWEPSWGPDFYVAERHHHGGGPGQIIRAALADLAAIKELTDSDRDCRQPCVSFDGVSVVFQEQASGDNWKLVLLNLVTNDEHDLLAGTDATFSHDNKRIVYSDSRGRLCVLDLASNAVRLVKVETRYSGAPSFSIDDRQIYYEGGPRGEDGGPSTSIYVTDVPAF